MFIIDSNSRHMDEKFVRVYHSKNILLFQIHKTVKLVLQVRDHRHGDKSSLVVFLIYGICLFFWF